MSRIELIREFTFHVRVGEGFRVGAVPLGTRSIGVIAGGWVRGERINGEVVGPGADWALFGADGWAEIDVRAQVRTDDGADLYVRYTGSLQADDTVMRALRSGAETAFGDQHWVVHLRLESGAPAYDWVNRTLFVGRGRVTTDGVEYEVHRIA